MLVRLQVDGRLFGPVRALLDSGAQPNLIPHRLVRSFNIPTQQATKRVVGIEGNTVQIHKQTKIGIVPWYSAELCMEEDFWVLPKDASWSLVTPQANIQQVRKSFEIPFADPSYWLRALVDILLGVKFFARVMVCSMPRVIGAMAAIETNFGIVIFGNNPIDTTERQIESASGLGCVEIDNLDSLIRQLWEMDQVGNGRVRTVEEQSVEDNFTNTARRDDEGRFIVTIPIKPNVQDIGDSRAIALRRFFMLERKLARDSALKESYVSFMREYESLGHMIKATRPPPTRQGQLVYYIPHHCVTKKFRVVFDCSCKTDRGISYNEVQQLGEKLQRDLYEIIMRFRRHKIAFSADIKMMFRQVKVARHQWDSQRIFWRESTGEKLQEYWLTVVTYGMTSSAYNAVRALIQCGRDARESYPDIEQIISNDFYMDDCVSGSDSEEEAFCTARRLDKVLKTAGFELRKWKSNSQWLAGELHSAEVEAMIFDNKEQATVLGLKWLVHQDQFTFVVKSPEITGKVTKRNLLSYVAQLYDPLGYIAPVTIIGKVMIQDLWRTGLDWDQEVPAKIGKRWQELWQGIKYLEQFRISRWLNTDSTARVQIHCFSDASTMAYGAVLYARVEQVNGKVTSKLIVSKTRVAPLKTISIPRLELAAAELLGRLLVELLKAMGWTNAEYILWTDSMVVLHWLQKLPRDMKAYVGNRVSSIQTNTYVNNWRHVGTKENPADLLSRGILPAEIVKSELWLYGPSWLVQQECNWPVNPIRGEIPPMAASEMQLCAIAQARETLGIWVPEQQALVPIEEYASRLEKAISVLGYVFQYINRLKARARECKQRQRSKIARHRSGPVAVSPTADERMQGLKFLIKKAQREAYGKDIANLQASGQLTEHSKIESLKPVFDSEGILRVGGRLHRASEEYEMRHPAIVPQGSRLAYLIVDHAHRMTKHGASQIMMQFIRQQYWIPRLRSELRGYLHKCPICVRYNYRLEQQLMAELPADRVQVGKPFLHTGVDYAGPFVVKIVDKNGKRITTKKVWVAVFVCLKTRAVHIDMIGDLTSLSFLACYERFVSRRGHCQRMFSDNGTSFVGAARVIRQAWKEWESDELFSKLNQRGTEWIFMVPAAPHQGGIYEAAVKSMKYHLKRIVGQRMLERDQFLTLLIGIEGILNSRPIHPLSDDPTDMQALTPGHFLVGEPIVLPPAFSPAGETAARGAKLFRERQMMFDHFWKRWREEYLVTLQERKKWRREKESLRVGQLVIIKSENFPPAQWAMGRISQLIMSKDGIVRSVVLQTEAGQLTRPVQKICILPIE